MLKYFRKHKNLTQAQLSKLIGISPQQLQKYEMGKNKISAARLKNIRHYLGVPASYFFNGIYSFNTIDRSKFGDSDSKKDLTRLINYYSHIKSEKIKKMFLQNISVFRRT